MRIAQNFLQRVKWLSNVNPEDRFRRNSNRERATIVLWLCTIFMMGVCSFLIGVGVGAHLAVGLTLIALPILIVGLYALAYDKDEELIDEYIEQQRKG